jgi:hypothetical protein
MPVQRVAKEMGKPVTMDTWESSSSRHVYDDGGIKAREEGPRSARVTAIRLSNKSSSLPRSGRMRQSERRITKAGSSEQDFSSRALAGNNLLVLANSGSIPRRRKTISARAAPGQVELIGPSYRVRCPPTQIDSNDCSLRIDLDTWSTLASAFHLCIHHTSPVPFMNDLSTVTIPLTAVVSCLGPLNQAYIGRSEGSCEHELSIPSKSS